MVTTIYLDGTGEQVSVVRQASGEGGTIKESERLLILVEFLGALELESHGNRCIKRGVCEVLVSCRVV